MTTHYKKNWLSALRSSVMLLAATLISGLSFGQLTGSYTINKSGTASSTVYTSIGSFISDLTKGTRADGGTANGPGVKGAVTATIAAKSGPYSENLTITEISGVSATNTITIKGNSQKVTTSNATAIKMEEVDYFRFDSLIIESTSSTQPKGVWMADCNYNKFTNCEITLPNSLGVYNYGSNYASAYVWMNDKTFYYQQAAKFNSYNEFRNNKMYSGTNKGPYIAILTNSTGSSGKSANTFDNNSIEDFVTFGFCRYYGGEEDVITNNTIYKAAGGTGTVYGYYQYTYFCGGGDSITGNKILLDKGNGSYDSRYGILAQPYYSSSKKACTVSNNVVDIKGSYYTYGIYVYGYQSGGDINVTFNTVNFRDPKITNTGRNYAMYLGYANGDCKNNIVYCDWINSGTTYGIYRFQSSGTCDYNNLHMDNAVNNGIIYYGYNGSNQSTFNDWVTAIGAKNSINQDPKLKDPDNRNFTPTSFKMVNKGTPVKGVTHDVNNSLRSTTTPDIGAVEFYLDVALPAEKMVGNIECGGYSESVVVSVKNTNADTISDIPLAYDVNGMGKVSEVYNGKIAPGATVDFTFSTVPTFNGGATHSVNIYLDGADDDPKNHNLTHKITTTESPFGAALTQGTNFPGYFQLGGNGGTFAKPDVTVTGQKVEYTIQNPTRHSGSTYGTSTGWDLTPVHMTSGGNVISSGVTFVAPTATTAGSVSYDPDATLGDSLIFIGFKANDKKTNCDSTFGRWIYVPHSPMVDFKVANVCDGEVLSFENTSTLAKGIMTYDWQFNDPSSTEDFSEISDPVYKYDTYGNYTVDLTVSLFDYPKFTWKKSLPVTVFPVPAVDFKVTNACEGLNVKFENKTTSPIAGKIDYLWNFGDTKTSDKETPTHLYGKAGGYKVTLSASLNGCASTIVKNANQFARPVAAFTVKGNCNLEDVEFNNGTTIAIGNTGYRWSFGDGEISNSMNPMHAFADPGSHKVQLLAISEFGCKDSTERTFNLNKSPKADFTFSDPCNLTEIEFTNTADLPTGNSIFEWDFNGESMSTNKNPKHLFSKVGVKDVTLKISSENGCSDEITKEFVVKLQAKADFVATNVCEGQEVVFTNKSEVAAGNLNYTWKFGDGNGSGLTSPRHGYSLATPGQTQTFNVTLVAGVPGGCSDSTAKAVTVNAQSDPSFTAKTTGRMLTISNQATTSSDFIYNWRFGDGGSSSAVTPNYEYYNVDQGEFEVCLGIINSANCLSQKCTTVTVDLVGIRDLALNNDMISAYPNPNTGIFTLDVKDAKSNLTIAVMNMMGEVVRYETPNDLSGSYRFDVSDMAAGVYLIQVKNGDFGAVQRITITK